MMTWCTVRWLCRHGVPLLVSRLECQSGHKYKSQHTLFRCTGALFSSQSNDSVNLNVDDNFQETSYSDNVIPFSDGRKVERTQSGQKEIFMLRPDSPPDAKVLRVAIIGRPNSGKSTLTNALMGWRVCSVSSKVHTTKKNTMAVYTEGSTQIVFVDTPGILKPGSRKKHDLDKSLEIDPVRSLATADLVIAVNDMDNRKSCRYMDTQVMQLLYMYRHIPAVLVLNKIDLLKDKNDILYSVRILTDSVIGGKCLEQFRKKKVSKKEKLFAATDRKLGLPTDSSDVNDEDNNNEIIPAELREPVEEAVRQGELSWEQFFDKVRAANKVVEKRRGWPLFDQVFSVSALRNKGLQDLKDHLMELAQPEAWPYHSSLVTDQPPSEVVLMSIRQALLDNLQNEIPYQLQMDIQLMEVDPEDELLNLIVNIKCQTQRQLTIFLGRDGEMIRKISSQAKQAIMDTFRCETRLSLIAKIVPKRKR